MTNDSKHINNNKQRNNIDDFFANTDIAYTKSKDEIWDNLVSKTETKATIAPINKTSNFKLNIVYSIAATMLLIAGMFSVLRYYTTTIKSSPNQYISTNLPDGSTVSLAPNSTLTYYPLWWQLSRKVSLEGEAFFDVEKGKQFNVTSSLGKTIVLGTSFNIFSRGDEYNVTCVTGKVKVVSITKQEVILTPSYHAELNKSGEIKVSKNSYNDFNSSSTKDGFSFTSVPLQLVIDEIEDYYNVKITYQGDLNYLYTGFFSKQKPIEEVLNILCKPFGITYVKKAEDNYEIIQ